MSESIARHELWSIVIAVERVERKVDRSCGATHLFPSFHPIEPFGRLAPSPDSVFVLSSSDSVHSCSEVLTTRSVLGGQQKKSPNATAATNQQDDE